LLLTNKVGVHGDVATCMAVSIYIARAVPESAAWPSNKEQ